VWILFCIIWLGESSSQREVPRKNIHDFSYLTVKFFFVFQRLTKKDVCRLRSGNLLSWPSSIGRVKLQIAFSLGLQLCDINDCIAVLRAVFVRNVDLIITETSRTLDVCSGRHYNRFYLMGLFICCLFNNAFSAWFQASAPMLMRSALFWDRTQRHMVIFYRRFGTTYRSPYSRVKNLYFLTLEV
jgi:hypothetical protein